MALFGKTSDDIVSEAIAELRNNTSITRFTPGAKARSLIRAMGRMVGGMYSIFDFNQAIAFVSGASGIYLDFIGELMGLSRLTGTQARVDSAEQNVMFYTLESSFGAINNGSSIDIPAGTLVTTVDTGRVIRYRVTDSATLPASQTQFFVSVEATDEGSSSNVGSNSLIEHSFTAYSSAANSLLLVTNTSAIDTGQAAEPDELYRFRIINGSFAQESANTHAIRLAALSVPSVSDVNMVEYDRGIGTSTIFLRGVNGRVTSSMVAAVQAAVNAVKSHSTHFLIEAPTEVGVQFEITITYRPLTREAVKNTVELDVARNLRNFIVNLDIGEPLIINEAVEVVMKTSDAILDIGLPSAPFDSVFVFKDGTISTNRVRRRLLDNYSTLSDETLVMEDSVANAVVIRRR